jgi:transposase
MEIRLTPSQRKRLYQQHRKTRDGRVRDRIKVVLAYDAGYSFEEIAQILLLDNKTIRRHLEDYWNVRKIAPENGGSSSKLTSEEMNELIIHLQEKTYRYIKDICSYVRQKYQKSYSISGMTNWLHEHKFRYKKPHAVPAKADGKKQEEFIELYRDLKKAIPPDEAIFFVDSVHPQNQARLAFGWILKGKRKKIPTTGRQYRVNIMGGICLDNHRVVYKQSDKIDAKSIQSFLRKLKKACPDKKKIHIILDNAGYHTSKEVKNYAKLLSIEMHYLPPYSPNLNPIERLWKIMHEQVTYNHYYGKFAEFEKAVLNFFSQIGRKKKILRSRITDNFQIINSPLLAS